MLYDILAMLAFLYGVCLWDTFKTADMERLRMDSKEPYIKTWWNTFLSNNYIYVTIAVPAAILLVVSVEVLKLFFRYY